MQAATTSAQARPARRTAPFPHRYDVTLEWEAGAVAALESAPRTPIAGGAPPEFGGTDAWWSPEQLLLGAASLCLMTTFQALAARKELPVQAYRTRAEGVLDRTAGGLAFTSVVLDVTVTVAAIDVVRAEQLLCDAKQHCIVANSLKVPIELRASVQAA